MSPGCDRMCDPNALEPVVLARIGWDVRDAKPQIRWHTGDRVTRLGRGSKGLITQRSRVQIPPPLQEKHQVRGPFPTGRGPLALLPCVRECVPNLSLIHISEP